MATSPPILGFLIWKREASSIWDVLGLRESEGLWGRALDPDPARGANGSFRRAGLLGGPLSAQILQWQPLAPAWPQPPEGGPSRAKVAQAEPEQSPAGKQWEGPAQPAGNSQPWGRRVGRGPAQGPMTSGEALTFCLNIPSDGVKAALLPLPMGKQKVLPIISP